MPSARPRARRGPTNALSFLSPPVRAPQQRSRAAEVGDIREGQVTWTLAHRDSIFRRALAFADLFSAGLAVTAAILLGNDSPSFGVLAALPLVVLAAKVAGLYDRDEHLLRKATLDEAPALFQLATVYTLVVWLLQGVFMDGFLGRDQVLGLWGLLTVALVGSRAAARRLAVALAEPERVLVLGDAEDCFELERVFARSHSIKAQIVGRVPLEEEVHAHGNGNSDDRHPAPLGTFGELADLLLTERVDRAVIAAPGSPTEKLLDRIRLVKSLGIKVSVLPRLFEVVGSSVEVEDLGGVMLLGLRRYELTTSSKLLKRSLDVVVSATALVLLAPLFAVIAIAIRVSSPGPVLFRQSRIGRHGVSFPMLKFRSMYDGADELKAELDEMNEAEGLFKIADDPRVTPVGRLMRRTSLDELPQLINVLRGEMSLVGPRPLVGDEDAQIKGWLRRRLDVIPGMTGIWQVHGSSRIPLREMVKMDYLYRANWSLWLDIKILVRTVPHVLSRRGL
jgi:exopolysaccharide biosynthesis polyprenyl glycosylphosphotransferase